MYFGTIQNDEGRFEDLKGNLLQLLKDKKGVNVFCRCAPMALVFSADKAETIDFVPFFRQYAYLLTGELPSVWYVSLCADMAFVPVKKVYQAGF